MTKNLFHDLYQSKNESEIDAVLIKHKGIFNNPSNWYPLGGEKNMFGVIENQQSSPIAALIEKITNSIDAILTKKCLEQNIDPKSELAPKSINEAIQQFYTGHNWDLPKFKQRQSEEIQIIADGYYKDRNKNTSLIIYDNGEGQHPENFEKTFLSLLRGNKNDVHFVQGKYNMGGSGAIVFCGEKRYQLIASKRFDNKGKFGFTLIRQHPLTPAEEIKFKNTWYEFFKIENKIPSFQIEDLELGLHNRKFKTGTIIKLYSYDLPSGSRSVISRDLNQSINEHLFEPALPILTVDRKERYPEDKNLIRDLYGLKRRLQDASDKYLDREPFSLDLTDQDFGQIKITCYLFKVKVEDKNVSDSKTSIRREFFKNNMSVLFSVYGQVHGNYTSEFISRTLKFHLLKDYLLIHVDCTNVKLKVRNELFMASRDRLKKGKETEALREFISDALQKSILKDIYKDRKDSVGLNSEDTVNLIKDFAQNMPKNPELLKLLKNTIKLKEKNIKSKKDDRTSLANKNEKEQNIYLKRFPSYFKYQNKKDGEVSVVSLPLNGEKTIKFDTDVENNYFDRIDEPGELTIELLKFKNGINKSSGGNALSKEISNMLNIIKSSPTNGIVRLTFNPVKEIKIDDEIEIKITLTSPEKNYEEILLIKIIKDEEKKKDTEKPKENFDDLGLPELVAVRKDKWSEIQNLGDEFDYNRIVLLESDDGDVLEKIYINLDSHVFKNFVSKHHNIQQIEFAEKRFLTSIYFHVLFLYTINMKNKFIIKQNDDDDVLLTEYLKNIFDDSYSEFIMNFGAESLMSVLDE